MYLLMKFMISDTMKQEIAVTPIRARYFSFSILLTSVKGMSRIDKQIPVTNQGWKYQFGSS